MDGVRTDVSGCLFGTEMLEVEAQTRTGKGSPTPRPPAVRVPASIVAYTDVKESTQMWK
jgi:hypothetical protein